MDQFQLFYPLRPFVVSQKFGVNLVDYNALLGFKGHPGWDMVGTTGQVIHAAHDGVVQSVEQDGRGGLGVVLRTNETYDYNGEQVYFKTIYWHCLTGSIKVQTGQQVKRGDVLAQCDSTGVRIGVNLTSDSHLHFGVKPSRYITDPRGNYYDNMLQDNGYGGAIDPQPFWNGKYFDEPIEEAPAENQIAKEALNTATEVVTTIKNSPAAPAQKLFLLSKVAQLLTLLLNVFKL